MPTWISHEPSWWIAVIDALLVVGVTFGLPLTTEQKGAIDAVLALVAGVAIRSQVTPTAKLAAAPVAGGPATAATLEQRIDELWKQREVIDAQLSEIGTITGTPPQSPNIPISTTIKEGGA